jgi:hypothetical protein
VGSRIFVRLIVRRLIRVFGWHEVFFNCRVEVVIHFDWVAGIVLLVVEPPVAFDLKNILSTPL